MTNPFSTARRIRLDLLEVTLVIGAVVILTLVLAERTQRPLNAPRFGSVDDEQLDARLRRQYGPGHDSLNPEEWIIRDFFGDKRGGVFVDVGAWHWRTGSNTYYLEHDLGWTGLAIDASAEFAEGWRQHRPRSRFVAAFVDDTDGTSRTFYGGSNSLTSSGERSIPDKFGGGAVSETDVKTARLDTLLARAGIEHVDFMSMDIELAEPAALSGFSIHKYKPSLVCIESQMAVRQRILEYFARAGYVALGEYLRYDPLNIYFAPLPDNGPVRVKVPPDHNIDASDVNRR
jgi:FkbM family methyltransferase